MSKFSLTRLSVAAGIGLLGASTAFAAPTCPESADPLADYKCAFINLGGGKQTDAFYALGYTGTLATSIYKANVAGVIGTGSQIIDTNRKSVIVANGFDNAVNGGSTYSTLSGGTASIKDTATVGERNIDSFLDIFGPGTQGLNFNYTLTYDYQINGTLGALGPSFNSGDFAVYFDDLSTIADEKIQVLRVNISGSVLNQANLKLLGTVSFDFDGNGALDDCLSTFCQNFWNFQDGPQNWYSLAAGQQVEINFMLNTNVAPPIPTANQLAIGSVPGTFARQTILNGEVRFNTVPEPGTLALAGLMLVGLAARSVRRQRKG